MKRTKWFRLVDDGDFVLGYFHNLMKAKRGFNAFGEK